MFWVLGLSGGDGFRSMVLRCLGGGGVFLHGSAVAGGGEKVEV